ncbi:hypothetical protein [Gloeobacter kilaueensis]|uniref:Uncharacterized protein n=1 Tax=Gloeobacter kilaueensis (strain ATCC BAA-2537 / CCAP 1431/1 / ULC 316 / JS1) TaxID=1183438 RepID=U5QNT8_GLOK1|nr:hypothetical protein [Gloeobacter kilaueensis]AGY59264.1 hypothetical protein GKIL_3018 [Gloeobacter kilaueensis JS1]
MENPQIRGIATFSDRQQAEGAVARLQHLGFDPERFVVVDSAESLGKKLAEGEVRDEIAHLAGSALLGGLAVGAAVGAGGGLLVAVAALWLPKIQPGPVLSGVWIAAATSLAGAIVGAATGSLAAALANLGIPNTRAEAYRQAIAWGGAVLLMDDTPRRIRRARRALKVAGFSQVDKILEPGSSVL